MRGKFDLLSLDTLAGVRAAAGLRVKSQLKKVI